MDLPPLLDRAQLHAAGYSDRELRQLLRRGELTPVRRGSYLRGAPPDGAPARHALAARAALARLAAGAVCSHVTAAVVHGLPVWRVPLERVHVTRAPNGSGSRTGARVHVHVARLRADEVTEIAGIPVTSVARTILDVARTVPFEAAVAIATQLCRAASRRRGARWTGPRSRLPWPVRTGGPAAGRPAGCSRSPTAAARAWGSPAAGWPSTWLGCRRRSCSGGSPTGTGS